MSPNLVFHSGDPAPLPLHSGDRRHLVSEFVRVQQRRLLFGPLELVPVEAPHAGRATIWALPGGGRATTVDLLAVARRNEWVRPVVVDVMVRYRVEVSQVT